MHVDSSEEKAAKQLIIHKRLAIQATRHWWKWVSLTKVERRCIAMAVQRGIKEVEIMPAELKRKISFQ